MRNRFMSTAATLLALMAVLVFAAAASAEPVELFQDEETGQIYITPGKNRVPLEPAQVEAVQAAMPSLYQDTATGAIYAKPADGRIPVASSERAAGAAPVAAAPAEDYSSQAFADAVKNIIGEKESATYPKVKLGAEAYVGYSYDYDNEKLNSDGSKPNKFSLNRGYINIKADLAPWLSARITPDISRIATTKYVTDITTTTDPVTGAVTSVKTKTATAPNAGDYSLRLKYYYLNFHDFLAFYPSLSVKLGQFEGAWLDHEEHLWTYRVQGTMMVEREGFMNSANLGVNLQGKIPSGYGEWQANFVNGEGYHADETNKYKSVQTRVTVNPLPGSELTKGLELTGFAFWGRKDKRTSRDIYDFLLGYKYKNALFVGAEYLITHGPDKFITHPGANNVDGAGVSVLGWFRMPFHEPLRLMARWDHFDHDVDSADNTINRYIYGASYDIGKYVTVLVDHERTVAKEYRGGFSSAYPDESLFKTDVLFKF